SWVAASLLVPTRCIARPTAAIAGPTPSRALHFQDQVSPHVPTLTLPACLPTRAATGGTWAGVSLRPSMAQFTTSMPPVILATAMRGISSTFAPPTAAQPLVLHC